MCGLERPGVEGVRKQGGFAIELSAEGGEEGHSFLVLLLLLLREREGILGLAGGELPGILLAVEDAAVEAAFDGFGLALLLQGLLGLGLGLRLLLLVGVGVGVGVGLWRLMLVVSRIAPQ